jgi:transcriptional regulator with XRE-family HTH domain
MNESPTTLPQRIEHVGKTVFGEHGWTLRLARAMGISRSQLFEFRNGRGNRDRDIDGELIDMIERDATALRGAMLTRLRNQLIGIVGKARKQEKRDAA